MTCFALKIQNLPIEECYAISKFFKKATTDPHKQFSAKLIDFAIIKTVKTVIAIALSV